MQSKPNRLDAFRRIVSAAEDFAEHGRQMNSDAFVLFLDAVRALGDELVTVAEHTTAEREDQREQGMGRTRSLLTALDAARIALPPLVPWRLCHEHDITTVTDLAAMSDEQLRAVGGIGPVTITRLRDQLDRWARVRLGLGATTDDYEAFLHTLLEEAPR
jgi:hypothetical protein